jgi:hypothetical protein
MVKSNATVKLMYRGFVISLNAEKRSSGGKSVHTHVFYHVPKLKPDYADKIDDRTCIETQNGEVECVSTQDTIGSVEASRLTASKLYYPSEDNSDKQGIIASWMPFIGSKEENTETSLLTMIRETINEVQSNIDEYIEAHSVVKISEDEVMHGLEQSVSEPLSGIDVSTPNINTDTSYDNVRPSSKKIAEELSI